jgi:hypothetical protein
VRLTRPSASTRHPTHRRPGCGTRGSCGATQ